MAEASAQRSTGMATLSTTKPPAGAVRFDYDGAGNLTDTSNGWHLGYNTKNHATSIQPPGQPADTANYADVGMAERVASPVPRIPPARSG